MEKAMGKKYEFPLKKEEERDHDHERELYMLELRNIADDLLKNVVNESKLNGVTVKRISSLIEDAKKENIDGLKRIKNRLLSGVPHNIQRIDKQTDEITGMVVVISKRINILEGKIVEEKPQAEIVSLEEERRKRRGSTNDIAS